MAITLTSASEWLREHPHTIASFAIGLLAGIGICLPLGWKLPDAIASLVGAAAGAAAAVGGAVWAAREKQEFENRNEAVRQDRRAHLMIIGAMEPILLMRLSIMSVRAVLRQAEEGKFDGSRPDFIKVATIEIHHRFPEVRDLMDLPDPVGQNTAAVLTVAAMYNSTVARLALPGKALIPIANMVEALELGRMLDQVQASLARAVNGMTRYEQSTAAIDYLERGDGTSVDLAILQEG